MSDRSDEYLLARLQEALARDPRVNEPELQVSLTGDKVLVTGVVPSEERRDLVTEVLQGLCPDRDIENRVDVFRGRGEEMEHLG